MRKRHSGHHSGGAHAGGMGQSTNRPHQKYGKPQRSSGGHHSNPQRPRKNYPALREKYMNQARDALASGDRVLAEYYLQHADHYYRMQMEYLEQRARWQEQAQPSEIEAAEAAEAAEHAEGDDEPDVIIPNNSNVLPAFLTRKVEVAENAGGKIVPLQEWEEEPR